MYDNGIWKIEIKVPGGQTLTEYFTRKMDAKMIGDELVKRFPGLTFEVSRWSPFDCRSGPFMAPEEELRAQTLKYILTRIRT